MDYRISRVVWLLVGYLILSFASGAAIADDPGDVYATYGVHNDAHRDRCAQSNCLYQRASGEPTDPSYPRYWSSHWVMYRVFNHFKEYPPPYDGKPPPPLEDGKDYQTSWGASYYDSTWAGPNGRGAMEEDYEKACLPIFPIPNNYSCSVISLGPIAYFITYDDRPAWMPPVCRFSPRNPPPPRDFVKHLPYSAADSARLGDRVQAYGFWTDAEGKPMQVGVRPDQTEADSQPTPDRVDHRAQPYRHPHSFYFSGMPYLPQVPLPNAPIISQNYTDFAMVKPDPAATWAKVQKLDPARLPKCQLFKPPR